MNDRLGRYFSELGALPLSAQVTGLDGRSTALDDFFADAIERIRATHAAGNTIIFIGNGAAPRSPATWRSITPRTAASVPWR